LAKCFKFFDIHNKGEVNFEQFYRTVEKIGVNIEKQVSLEMVLIHQRISKECFNTMIKMEMVK
jgi:Ca2+-binding EF-hand superfamily protein